MIIFLCAPSYFFLCGDFDARIGCDGEEAQIVPDMFELCDLHCIPHSDNALDVIASNYPEHFVEFGETAAEGFSAQPHLILLCRNL